MSLRPKMKEAWESPTQEALEEQALDYYKANKPKEYREMKQNNSLQEVCQRAARATRRYAQSLIASGVWEREAWNLAIRQEILNSESD